MRGVVAAGHSATAAAAEAVLTDGGNAFDAVIAGLSAACVVESALASLGGGGFLLAKPAAGPPRVYDFFAHTPKRRKPEAELELRAIRTDFEDTGMAREIPIGRGTIAVPGLVRGLFDVHADLGTVPLTELVRPAIECAKKGTELSDFQAHVFDLRQDILRSSSACFHLYRSPADPTRLLSKGEIHYQPELADTLESLALEGADLFYRGEIAARIAADSVHGGHLTRQDFEDYRVLRREPLHFSYRDRQLFTNPPPSPAGLLVAFALGLLHDGRAWERVELGSARHVLTLANVMDFTSQARLGAALDGKIGDEDVGALLEPAQLAIWRERLQGGAPSIRGTTHISVIDRHGNAVAASVSNGAGSGHVIPGAGIMLNNLLEDGLGLAKGYRWLTDERMASMMAPTIVLGPGVDIIATGAGGSSRIWTAVLQVLVNLIDFAMEVEDAVSSPRVHFEDGLLNVEGGFDPGRIGAALTSFPRHELWPSRSMFFGGAHSVRRVDDHLEGGGDPRRGGTCGTI